MGRRKANIEILQAMVVRVLGGQDGLVILDINNSTSAFWHSVFRKNNE